MIPLSEQTPRRILQTGDLHIQTREMVDQRPVLDWIAERAAAAAVDLVIIGGDLTGTACPHLSRPAERQAVVDLCLSCRRRGDPVIVVRGNHDVPEDWRFLDAIDGVYWVERPTTFTLGSLALHVLPYPDRSWLAGAADTGEDATALMTQALTTIIRGMDAEAQGMRQILTGHCNVRGAVASTGQPMIGADVELPTEVFAGLSIPLVLLNHIHLPQRIDRAGTRVEHVGSPWPTTYGETEEKRIVEVEWPGAVPVVRSVPTPCVGKVTVDLDWADGVWVEREPVYPTCARLRLRLHYDEGQDVDEAAARAMAAGAVGVKVERCPVPRRRERAPEVVQARGLVDRFLAYEASEGREVDETLHALAAELAK